MSTSAIEWTDATWNPVTGCDRVSPGCARCYALELAPRLRAMGVQRYVDARDGERASSGPAFGVTLHPDVLEQPLRWRKPRRVFVNSMSDLFHEDVPDEFIDRVFDVMAECPQHTFQVLTKRPERMRDYMGWAEGRALSGGDVLPGAPWSDPMGAPLYPWPLPNVWLGVSIENRRFVGRADVLRKTPAAVRFISAEPLLGPLLPDGDWVDPYDHTVYPPDDFPVTAIREWADGYSGPGLWLEEIDWLIVGGESGVGHRPIRAEWVRELRDYCRDECWQGEREGATAFFFKQWGGRTPKAGGRELDGRTYDEFPPVAV
jgi:protein gp37